MQITSTDSAIALWLAESHDDPHSVYLDWRNRRHTMLPTGIRFDAVRITPELVHAAVDSVDQEPIAKALTNALQGAVIRDPCWYYALVPPQTSETWRCPLAQCRGRGTWLGVPRLELVEPLGLHWCVPMAYAGQLCEPADVAGLIELGHERLTAR